ncbi:FxsA family protein [Allorhodopirellula heiligendammensis]|uniref:Phage T7 F exclusion suppressor FxsA n=1 Tax=Allorhodopirellula heiligendammensis TaxID=2714739 RepID=A0A5C6C5L8_9BACT|nr:FxsA family protein [Allorhodopirellula heiligendammensis]TWU19297.1 phage T7 F exclusion suppressor FxsA [Allorhodopirellula heiligendammensis]
MLIRLFALFICVPFIELVLLLRMADATSWMMTLTIVIVTGVIGSLLARREGLAALMRFRAALASGRMPGREIQDGMMIAFAAALLLTPGLLTDSLGFFLLTPFGRRTVGGFLRRRYAGRFQIHTSGFHPQSPSSPDVDPASASGQWRPHPSGGDRFTIDAPSFGPKQGQSH